MAGYNFCETPLEVSLVNSKYRRIKTKIPTPSSVSILKGLKKYESRSMHGQLPVAWDRAEGFQVFDEYGNRWIDFTSTIFVANSGHSNPEIIKAIKKQLDQRLIHTYTFASEIRLKFLEKLISITPSFCEKAFLLSAGTEATECAVKLMRMHGQKKRADKNIVISFKGNMHGRTMAAEMLKDDFSSSAWIGYKDPNMHSLPFPYPWKKNDFKQDIESLRKNGIKYSNICGFIIESYQGWGAVMYPKAYMAELYRFAKKYNFIITFDEIQGGFGRTGKLFVYQHYGIEPDLLCLGKAISGGLPLSAVIGRKNIMDLPEIGSMSSTHSANPISCAAGLANLEEIIKKNLISEAKRKGKILHARLNEIMDRFSHRISYVFGEGLLAAVIFKHPKTGKPDGLFASRVCELAMQKGLLLVHTGRESIKIGPPLVIKDLALKEGLDVLEECINEIDRKG